MSLEHVQHETSNFMTVSFAEYAKRVKSLMLSELFNKMLSKMIIDPNAKTFLTHKSMYCEALPMCTGRVCFRKITKKCYLFWLEKLYYLEVWQKSIILYRPVNIIVR